MKNTLIMVIIFGIVSGLLTALLSQALIAGIVFSAFVSILALSEKKIGAKKIVRFNFFSVLAYFLSYAIVFVYMFKEVGDSVSGVGGDTENFYLAAIFFVAGIVGGAVFSYAFRFIHYIDKKSVMLLIGTSAIVSSVGAFVTLPYSFSPPFNLFTGTGGMFLPLFISWNLVMMFLCSRMLKINYPAPPAPSNARTKMSCGDWLKDVESDGK